MYFHIFSEGWPSSEISKSVELVTGDLNIDQIKTIPEILKNWIIYQHKKFIETQSQMNEKNLEQIRRDVEKNKKITGSDKSTNRSK